MRTTRINSGRWENALRRLRSAMRSLALLALSLVGAAQGSNLLYLKGCSDTSKANYYSNNPDSEAECWPLATVYCPDPLADNYNAASCKLRPRTSRMPCPPSSQSPLPSLARRANAHPTACALAGAHTRARRLTPEQAPPPPPPSPPPPPPRQRPPAPHPTLGPHPTHRATRNAGPAHRAASPFLAWQLPGATPPLMPTSPIRWPWRPTAPTTSMGAATRRLPTTRLLCRRPLAISGP